MKTITLNVEGMTCGGCANSVTRVLTELAGVQSAEVSHTAGQAVVTFDESLVSEIALTEAIEDAGYDVVK